MGILSRDRIFNKNTPSGTLLDTDLRPTIENSLLRIRVCFSVAGKLSVKKTLEDKTVYTILNNGNDLAAGAAYTFEIPIRADVLYNFKYSGTTGKTELLQIEEISP